MALKKLTIDAYLFYQQAEAFNRSAATEEEIVLAGEKALLCVYNCKSPVESLETLRCTRFCQQAATGATFVQPESLPPTSAAVAYHSQRAYFQIQQWKGIPLKPEDWGYKLQLTAGKLLPVRMDLPPAHAFLLEFVRCNCRTDCSTQRCTCRKHGLDCSPACGECKVTVALIQPRLT